jgi:sugar phosphate permease
MPNEMATRMALFNLAQPIGGIISGVMQAGLTKNLDGKLGRSGWRWAFIVNGVCTIVVALIAFVTQPGMPDKPNPLARWYLTDEDYEIARRRNRRAKYTPQRPLTLKSFFNAFRYWQVYALVCCWSYGYNTVPSNFFNLWLKSLVNADGSKRFSVPQLSLIPMGGHAVCFIAIILFCGLSDRIGARLPSLLACAALNLVSQVILVMRPENDATHMAGYFLNYAGLPAYLLIATWAGTYLAHLPEVKVVMYATGTTVSYLSVAFIPLWAYPAKEAPNWNVGAKFYLGSMCVVTAVFIATAYGLRWEQRKQLRREGKEVPKRNWFYWLWT